jgi:oligopeptide transport system substrate-binding protein
LAISLITGAKGVDPETNSITISLQSEPPNLDNSLSQDTTSGSLLVMIQEGLMRTGNRGEILPAVAESWELDDQEITFRLRKDALWQDGEPVRARDFVYSWRRLVNPATGASGSTFFSYVLDNAEAILRGELPPEALGVEALDDSTLKVTLSRPVPYILPVLTGTAYYPQREDFVEAQDGRYGADAENLLANGPFILESWTHNSSITLKRNPRYWGREDIRLDQIDVGYITSDVRSLLNVYKSHELAALRLSEEILSDAMSSGLRIKKAPTNCLAWLTLNMQPGRLTANPKVREAIRLAFDRDRYVNTIVGLPGTRKIESVFTKRIQGVKRNFQREFPATPIEFNIEKARRLIGEVKEEMGTEQLPPVILLANETRQIEAEFLQAQLSAALGLDIRVDKQTFKQAIAKMQAHDYDIARAGFCGGTLTDPVFFAGIFVSGGPFNTGVYSNPAYDELMAVTHSTGNQQMRMEAFGKIQQLLYEDIPIIPSHESSNVYLQEDTVKGLRRYPATNFSRGYIQ